MQTPQSGESHSTSPHRSRRSFSVRALGVLISGYVGVVGLLAGLQRMLMYHPRKGPVPLDLAGELTPHLREVQVTVPDGISLHGWLCVQESDSPIGRDQPLRSLADRNRFLVVMFAGNAGNRSTRLSQIALYRDLGCDALLVDYRGYGENSGTPSEASLLQDSQAVWKFATQQLGIPPQRIIISGESLGGGVAVALASHVCRSDEVPAALILRATFSSMVDAAAYNYWWLPVRMVLLDRYPSAERIPHVVCPRLHYHGDQDEIVPWSLGKKLFESGPAKSQHGIAGRFVTIPGAGHNDVFKLGAEQIRDEIRQLLARIQTPMV